MIDSSIYAVDIPAGTYAAGDELPMKCVFGPSVVRDGYGKAVLKQVVMFNSSSNVTNLSYVEFKNSNWNDSLKTMVSSVASNNALTALSKTSPAIQRCGDVELQPNSSFVAKFVVGQAVTTTNDISAFCLVDIDYPSVSAVLNPRDEKGLPVSILRDDSVTVTADGAAESMVWTTVNVDEFKAGYRYLLAQIGCEGSSTTLISFIAFSGAPSMNGLVRVIPAIPRQALASRMELEYSTPFVKGPMNISYAAIGTAGTDNFRLECDYIRR